MTFDCIVILIEESLCQFYYCNFQKGYMSFFKHCWSTFTSLCSDIFHIVIYVISNEIHFLAWPSFLHLGDFFEALRHCDGVVGMQQDDVADGLLELISAGRPELLRGRWHSHSLLRDTHAHTRRGHNLATHWSHRAFPDHTVISMTTYAGYIFIMRKHDNHCPFTKKLCKIQSIFFFFLQRQILGKLKVFILFISKYSLCFIIYTL